MSKDHTGVCALRARFTGHGCIQVARSLFALLALVIAACSSGTNGPLSASPAPTAASTKIPRFSHVFVIVMENESAQAILGKPAAAYINQLAGQYDVALRYFAVSHPSLPNYLALTSGTTAPLDGTDCGVSSDCHVPGANSNLADEIEASGRSWVAYMESMPAPCTLMNSHQYVVRHNPFVYYDDIRTGAGGRCALHDLPYDRVAFESALALGQAPDFVWITPNVCNDGHDPCGGDPVAHSDAWLAQNVPAILASSAFQQGGALFITWDEGSSDEGCCGLASGGGQVATMVISPLARGAYQSTVLYTHYSLLRTIEESWHLGLLNNTNPAVRPGTRPMDDIFATG